MRLRTFRRTGASEDGRNGQMQGTISTEIPLAHGVAKPKNSSREKEWVIARSPGIDLALELSRSARGRRVGVEFGKDETEMSNGATLSTQDQLGRIGVATGVGRIVLPASEDRRAARQMAHPDLPIVARDRIDLVARRADEEVPRQSWFPNDRSTVRDPLAVAPPAP